VHGDRADPSGFFAEPFSIGGLRLANRVVLAPMAGVTNSPFRRLLKRHGVGLVVSEMVSVHGLLYGNRRTRDYLGFAPEERPFALQLFGDRPEAVGEAVRQVLQKPVAPDLIDLNMGCPVRKVVKTGAGCALLSDPERAVAVARAAVQGAAGSGVPVTVKLRSGLTPEHVIAVELASRLEEAGVAGLAVHPRAASQLYQGNADHEVTAAVAAAVSIPVVASGDVLSVAGARTIAERTGAAAVMVARGVQGNPWLVDDLLAGSDRRRPPLEVVVGELLLLLDLAQAEMGPVRTARWLRRSLTWFLRPSGVRPAVIQQLRGLEDADRVRGALTELVGGH